MQQQKCFMMNSKHDNLIIGEKKKIGVNSVLTKSIGDNEIWAGVPAKNIGNIYV